MDDKPKRIKHRNIPQQVFRLTRNGKHIMNFTGMNNRLSQTVRDGDVLEVANRRYDGSEWISQRMKRRGKNWINEDFEDDMDYKEVYAIITGMPMFINDVLGVFTTWKKVMQALPFMVEVYPEMAIIKVKLDYLISSIAPPYEYIREVKGGILIDPEQVYG